MTALTIIVGIGIAVCFWFMKHSTVTDYDISKIKNGDTKDKVLAMFGRPREVINFGGSTEEWIYTVPFRVYVSIRFDYQGFVYQIYRSGTMVGKSQ